MNQEEQYIFAKGVAAGLRIAQELNTIKTVKTEVVKEGIVKKVIVKKKNKGGKWTEEEDKLMRENKNLSGNELAKLFPSRSFVSIATHKSNLGLKVDKKVEDNCLAHLNQ